VTVRLWLLVALLLTALVPAQVSAHALEPGFLEVQPLGGPEWRVTWRKPQISGAPMAIDALLPESCTPRRGPAPVFDGRAFLSGWIAVCDLGLAGQTITIEGLESTRTDVLVRYTLEGDTSARTTRLTASEPSFIVPKVQGPLGVFQSYAALGMDHILKGVDHLIFVLLLILLIRDWRKLLAAITAFTVAHSLSLAAATLGWVVLPAPPVEAFIALSILFLASELLQAPGADQRLSARYPWVVAFAFGLLHGLGFARGLREVGLPEGDVPLALFSFNVGVEVAQILFIAVALGLGAALTRLAPGNGALLAPGSRSLRAMGYAFGTLAAFWMVQQVAGFIA
jgi:hydrogenase/urease accessory protein HupE